MDCAALGELCEHFNRRCERLCWPMRCDARRAFTAPELREAFDVWHRCADGRTFPLRSDLTPRIMKHFLPHVALLDIVHEAARIRFRGRVAGTAIGQLLVNATGYFLDEIVVEPFLSRWEAMLNLALEAAAPVRTTSRLEFRDQTFLRVETLLAPLGAGPGAPDSILVVAVAREDLS